MAANDGNGDTLAAATVPSSSRPRLFVVKLHESPHLNDNYERYSMKWMVDTNDTTTTTLQQGDVLYMPELETGAGEFEGVRFVGTLSNGGYELWSAGIESPAFPQAIVEHQTPQELRRLYEEYFDIILQQQQGLSLVDLFGGQEVVEEYWANPDVERRLRRLEGEWHIPWSECEVLSIHDSNTSI